MAIVGGGIVGLATAMALVRRGRLPLVVLEAEARIASHQTGHNSGVIHSGLYYKPGSLKAALCATGRDALYQFCVDEGIPHRRCGKVVVATRPEEIATLDALEQRGRANGLRGLERLTPAGIREREPEVDGLAGLWVEETGVVDFAQVASAYARIAEQGGAEIRTGARVTAIRPEPGGICVETATGPVHARFLLSCAGLQADRVARASGVEPDVRIVPFRGDYFELVPERRGMARGLIYPVPDPALPFLGVHLTRRIDGRVEAGPNAVLALKREGYRPRDVSLRDLADSFSFPGFWRLARRHWRTALAELNQSVSQQSFLRALQRLVPRVRANDLVRGASGVRAQAVDRSGRLVDDFSLVQTDRMIHVLNAPSPAATASLGVGERLADLACGIGHRAPKP